MCYSGGEQPENSFFDGSSTAVLSLADRFIKAGASTSYSKAASQSGSEMVGGTNNFETQAKSVVSRVTQPTQVKVELGGNDICRRATTAELYDAAVWETGVRKGLDVLTGLNGSTTRLPKGSTVILVGVPRVQDLHDVGVAKSSSRVNCPSFWETYDVCEIATVDRMIGNETLAQRLVTVGDRQVAYNTKMKVLAAEYNLKATTTGVEVVVESDGVTTVGTRTVPEVGAYRFSTTEINGGDCFHPSIAGQNKLSEIIWGNDPYTTRR
jgi:hypothetical protein